MFEKLYDNPGDATKKLSMIIFYSCLIIGVITLCVGIANMFKVVANTGESFFEFMSYSIVDAMTTDWRAEGYAAKTRILQGLYITLASLTAIPLYGLGCLIEDVGAIRSSTTRENK